MSQSYANTNSFPIEFYPAGSRSDVWVWPKFSFDPLSGLSRFLRVPGPRDSLGYRVMRTAAIVVLKVRSVNS